MTKAQLAAQVADLEDIVDKVRSGQLKDPQVFELLARRARALEFLSNQRNVRRFIKASRVAGDPSQSL